MRTRGRNVIMFNQPCSATSSWTGLNVDKVIGAIVSCASVWLTGGHGFRRGAAGGGLLWSLPEGHHLFRSIARRAALCLPRI